MDHSPCSLWNVLLKLKFLKMQVVFIFLLSLRLYLFLIMWFLFNQTNLLLLAWKQIGSRMLRSVNKQVANVNVTFSEEQ